MFLVNIDPALINRTVDDRKVHEEKINMPGYCGQRTPDASEVLREEMRERKLKTSKAFERVQKAKADLRKAENEYSLALKEEVKAGKQALGIE
jgi:hypothetical protein